VRIRIKCLGKFDSTTVILAAMLDVPHHEGAEGIDDFVDNDLFQNHFKRVKKSKEKTEIIRPYLTLTLTLNLTLDLTLTNKELPTKREENIYISHILVMYMNPC
jgi:hypothetical protein